MTQENNDGETGVILVVMAITAEGDMATTRTEGEGARIATMGFRLRCMTIMGDLVEGAL